MRHTQLFRDGHTAARGLFAITQCGVEKEHSIEDWFLAHRGATSSRTTVGIVADLVP
jgi:hypothetical protein